MYPFILNMWVAGKIKETKVNEYVAKGFITQEEANLILATPQTTPTA